VSGVSIQRNPKGLEKVAVLLISLGSDLSSLILKQGCFYDHEVERISYAITNMDVISQNMKEKVLKEFGELSQAREYLVKGGLGYAKELLIKTYGKQKAEIILERLASDFKPPPFNALRKTDPRVLFNFIRNEHPQTIALILSYLEPEQASVIVESMPPELQGEIARRIAMMERTSPEITQDLERLLESKLSSVVLQDQNTVGGIKTLVDILNVVGRGTEKTVLEKLEYEDPGLAEEVRKRMFIFEDILKLDDLSIQRFLRDVNTKDLALAMRGASEPVRQCIYRNQSKRASELLRDEIEYMGPVRVKDVEEAQMKIVRVIRNLEESGEILVSRGGEDSIVI
jgi:flagellar motor switch protein FliG